MNNNINYNKIRLISSLIIDVCNKLIETKSEKIIYDNDDQEAANAFFNILNNSINIEMPHEVFSDVISLLGVIHENGSPKRAMHLCEMLIESTERIIPESEKWFVLGQPLSEEKICELLELA